MSNFAASSAAVDVWIVRGFLLPLFLTFCLNIQIIVKANPYFLHQTTTYVVYSLKSIRESNVGNPFSTPVFLLYLLLMWQWLKSSDPPLDALHTYISTLEYRLSIKECCPLFCSLCTPDCLFCVLINVLCLLLMQERSWVWRMSRSSKRLRLVGKIFVHKRDEVPEYKYSHVAPFVCVCAKTSSISLGNPLLL